MKDNLQDNLNMKHKLKFDKNGNFKILMMSDIQETLNYDIRTLENMNKLIENVNPNLIILGGDNCDGTILKNEIELRKYLEIFSTPMESKKIPWAHVFGNHDHDIPLNDRKKQKYMKNILIVFQSIQKKFMVLLILYYLLNIQIKMKLLLIFGD